MSHCSYIFAKNGCGNPINLNGKKVYFPYHGANGIPKDEMKVYTHNKKFNVNGFRPFLYILAYNLI